MILGKCLCGEINIKINGNISDIIHCHCSLCRRTVAVLMQLTALLRPVNLK